MCARATTMSEEEEVPEQKGWFSRLATGLAKSVGEGLDLCVPPRAPLQDPSPRQTVHTAGRAGSQNLSIRRPLTDPGPRPPASRSIAGVEDPADLETKDDGSGAGTGGENATERKALWSQLKDLIGADESSKLSVPVFIMEPTTMLQKMSEILQYAALLDAAADEEDEDMRLAYVCALAISTYSSSERTKTVQPLLGETWEFQLRGRRRHVRLGAGVPPPRGRGPLQDREVDVRPDVRGEDQVHGQLVDVWPKGRTRSTRARGRRATCRATSAPRLAREQHYRRARVD